MPAPRKRRKPRRVPSLRHHKASGQGFVELNGYRKYLGVYGKPETEEHYHRVIAEWLANGRRLPVEPEKVLVVNLCAAFWRHAEEYYRKPNGEPTSSIDHIRTILKPLRRLYGSVRVAEFTPATLKAIRQQFIDDGLCRGVVNQRTNLIRRVFKWGVAEGLVPVETHAALTTLEGLRRGRTEARETDPVKPVPEAWIEAVRLFVNRHVWAMIQLQYWTGMRGGEVVMMRGRDLDTTGKVWTYTPEDHKTAHHGHERTVYIGPKAQDVIRPFLRSDLSAYLFSPAEAEQERRAKQSVERQTPEKWGNKPGTNRREKPKRKAGERYTTASYRRAIHRACDRAFPPPEKLARIRVEDQQGRERWETPAEWKKRLGAQQWAELRRWEMDHRWSPHPLRHNAATNIRREFGIEVAQTILGHRLGSGITEVYAEANIERAKSVMQSVG